MGYQTTIIDAERVFHPITRKFTERLIWQGLSPFAGKIERVIFRVNPVIGEDFKVEYLMRMIVKLSCRKRIIKDTTCRNRRAGVRFLIEEVQKSVAHETNFQSRATANSWRRLARRIRARFEYMNLSRMKAVT